MYNDKEQAQTAKTVQDVVAKVSESPCPLHTDFMLESSSHMETPHAKRRGNTAPSSQSHSHAVGQRYSGLHTDKIADISLSPEVAQRDYTSLRPVVGTILL